MIKFILNNQVVETFLPAGKVLLDFIRYDKSMTGTKIGCREGDCGACTVLVGEIVNDELRYRSMTSCLLALGNVHGKHIVTVEGVNMSELNPVQQAMAEEGATQCGFCTPGFVMSLAGFCLKNRIADAEAEVIAAIDGNICRCTGYKSIERAAKKIAAQVGNRSSEDGAKLAAEKQLLPAYFATIKERLAQLTREVVKRETVQSKVISGGGTDLYVQRHDAMTHADIHFTTHDAELKNIQVKGNQCIIGGSVTVTDLCESPIIRNAFPDFMKVAKLISSTPIRNMATIAGNFVNASPIGDFTAFFLALETTLLLSDGKNKREVALRDFYKGYKQLDKKENEVVSEICFELPDKQTQFNFEKVCKRTHLDIASVNSAMRIQLNGDLISDVAISAGGVSPIPLYLRKTSSFLKGKKFTSNVLNEALEIVQTEVSPISDARGSADYKRLLLTQLIRAHFIQFIPSS